MDSGLISTLKDNWEVIAKAPWAFLAVAAIIAALVWVIISHLKANQLEGLEARLKLRDDEITDYKRKLSGASPDEAKAEIEALKEAVRRLQPKELTEAAVAMITQIARASPGAASISYDMSYAAGQKMAGQLQRALAAAGWQVSGGIVGGPSFLPAEGIAVALRPHPERTPAESAICSALTAVNLAYAVAPYRDNPHRPDAVEIVLTQPAD